MDDTPSRDTGERPDEIVNDDPGNGCFGCSPHNASGLRLRFRPTGPTSIESRYTAPVSQAGAPGVVHGGVQAALLDEVLGMAAHLDDPADEMHLVTVDFRLRYRRPVPVGREITIRARLQRFDGRDAFVEGEIVDGEGQVLTTAEARWRRIDDRPRAASTDAPQAVAPPSDEVR